MTKSLHVLNCGCLLSLLLVNLRAQPMEIYFVLTVFCFFPRMKCSEMSSNQDTYIFIFTILGNLFNTQCITNKIVVPYQQFRIHHSKYHCDITPTSAHLPVKSCHGFDTISGKLLKRKQEAKGAPENLIQMTLPILVFFFLRKEYVYSFDGMHYE